MMFSFGPREGTVVPLYASLRRLTLRLSNGIRRAARRGRFYG